MMAEKAKARRSPRAVYPETAIVDAEQLADALGVSVDTIEGMDLPTVMIGKRTRRYVFRQILRILEERAAA